ncbi:MAG TPA: hypothetical protein VM597_33100, partial [Gemmataceae bacterium]|nr:hypothetical protein [Gemmataceae bacterium]
MRSAIPALVGVIAVALAGAFLAADLPQPGTPPGAAPTSDPHPVSLTRCGGETAHHAFHLVTSPNWGGTARTSETGGH